MTDLRRLTVSLTKHGAHKVADLIEAFPRDLILLNISGTYRDIKIDRAQTRNNLFGNNNDILPEVWDDVREKGRRQIEALLLTSIIFRHHKLIETMIYSGDGNFRGEVLWEECQAHGTLDRKAFTNLKCIFEELGFSFDFSADSFRYDLSDIFQLNDGFYLDVKTILELSLQIAGWNRGNEFIDECITNEFHKVFSTTENLFSDWIMNRQFEKNNVHRIDNDQLLEGLNDFEFQRGHSQNDIETIYYRIPEEEREISFLHRKIQTELYKYLVNIYGEDNVGTEAAWEHGLVDIVADIPGGLVFYEIKTDASVRLCIRNAISQLLEYAYWPRANRAGKLVVVALHEPTSESISYINYLNERFQLPIEYQQFNFQTGRLIS